MLRTCYKLWLLAAALFRGGKNERLLNVIDFAESGSASPPPSHLDHQDHEMAHRALVHLMNQRTESMLAALSNAIETERQKVGGFVRNPSMNAAFAAAMPPETAAFQDDAAAHGRILSMAQEGLAVSMISHQLKLPEDEVSMVLRFHAE